jgi:flavodoxin I
MTKALIIYETRSGGTKQIAEAIQAGMIESGIETTLKTINEVNAAELGDYDSVSLGAPTYNHDLIPSMKAFFFKIEKAPLKGKIGAAFGSYGWSGESIQMIGETMEHIYGMEVLTPRIKLTGGVNEEKLKRFKDFGKQVAAAIKEHK